VNLEEPINSKQILNHIELAVKDISNVKEKHISTTEEYDKLKVFIERIQNRIQGLKLEIDNPIEDIELVDWSKHNLLIENSNKNFEQHKAEFEQLKKGKLTSQVSF